MAATFREFKDQVTGMLAWLSEFAGKEGVERNFEGARRVLETEIFPYVEMIVQHGRGDENSRQAVSYSLQEMLSFADGLPDNLRKGYTERLKTLGEMIDGFAIELPENFYARLVEKEKSTGLHGRDTDRRGGGLGL